jgi:Tfp pilus assembly protein PilX
MHGQRQRGAALIVSLILLALMTVLAIASFRLGKSNLVIAGNMQQREQGMAAAQGAIELAISSTQFVGTPANAIPNPCGAPNNVYVDVNGDGVTDINVTVLPTCLVIAPITNAQLNLANPNDAGCTVGAGQDFGVAGGATNASMCANSVWNIRATATDVATNAQYVIDEGANVRVPSSTVCP